MSKYSDFRMTSKKTLFICILMFAFCSLFVSTGAAALVQVDISKNGNQYSAGDGNIGSISGTSAVHLNGGHLYYEFNVSEWAPWLSNFTVGVDHCGADRNEAVKGGVWANVQIKDNTGNYSLLEDLTQTGDTRATLWNSTAIDGQSKLEASGNGYKITVLIYAKYGFTDHAEANVYIVTLRLNLNYDQFNTFQVDGSPRVVDFGRVTKLPAEVSAATLTWEALSPTKA